MKGLSSKCIALRVDVIQNQKIYRLQGCPCTFSPQVLQAGAVKGLTIQLDIAKCQCSCTRNVFVVPSTDLVRTWWIIVKERNDLQNRVKQ